MLILRMPDWRFWSISAMFCSGWCRSYGRCQCYQLWLFLKVFIFKSQLAFFARNFKLTQLVSGTRILAKFLINNKLVELGTLSCCLHTFRVVSRSNTQVRFKWAFETSQTTKENLLNKNFLFTKLRLVFYHSTWDITENVPRW